MQKGIVAWIPPTVDEKQDWKVFFPSYLAIKPKHINNKIKPPTHTIMTTAI